MTSSAARTRGIASSSAVGDEFRYEPLFDVRAPKDVEWRLVTTEGVSETRGPDGEAYVKVEPSALRALACAAAAGSASEGDTVAAAIGAVQRRDAAARRLGGGDALGQFHAYFSSRKAER